MVYIIRPKSRKSINRIFVFFFLIYPSVSKNIALETLKNEKWKMKKRKRKRKRYIVHLIQFMDVIKKYGVCLGGLGCNWTNFYFLVESVYLYFKLSEFYYRKREVTFWELKSYQVNKVQKLMWDLFL